MAWQVLASLSGGNQPVSIIDTQLTNLAKWSLVGCTASGTNVITLTPILTGYTAPAYGNFAAYTFAAANTTSGAVTLKVGALAALSVYKSDGTTQITTGDIVANQCYQVSYNGALNASAGGWYLQSVGRDAQSVTGVTQSAAGGRLTLVTATPVMTTSQSAKTTVYYTPYNSSLISYYTGSVWATNTFAELSIPLDSNAGHTGYQQSGKNFDIFYDNNAGSPRIVTGPAWTSNTARADAIVQLSGIWVNNASIVTKFDTSASTATIAANLLTYLGTMRASADGQTQFIFGAVAAGGAAGSFLLWNCYNRRPLSSFVGETTDSWSYATAAWRAANGSATMRHSVVIGINEDALQARYQSSMYAITNAATVGVGLDVTNSYTGNAPYIITSSGVYVSAVAEYAGLPGLGFHFLSANEYGSTGGSVFSGDGGGPTFVQCGLSINVWM